MIAITGGIAEGKSTVLEYLKEAGERCASADAIARQFFESPQITRAVADRLGTGAAPTREQVRQELADHEFRRWLNKLLHPLVMKEIRASGARFVEVPLLIEGALQPQFERVWIVTCGAQEQMRRLIARLGSESAAKAILSTQLPTRAKIPFADTVVRTNEPEVNVQRYVFAALEAEKC